VEQREIIGNIQGQATVPASAIENEGRVHIRSQLTAQVIQMALHGLGVGKRHQPAIAGTRLRTHGTEEVEVFVVGLSGCQRMAARIVPNAAIAALLSEAGLILEPQFDALARMFSLDRREAFRQLVF